MSGCPAHRDRMTLKAANNTMKSVAPSTCAKSKSARVRSIGTSAVRFAPWWFCDAERSRSVGNSSASEAPASRSPQYEICLSKTSPLSQSRCHKATSAY